MGYWGDALKGGAGGAVAGSTFGPWGAAIGGGLGALGGLFGGKQQHAQDKRTQELLSQIPDQLKQYIMPYITAGQGALGKAGGEYDKLISDPNAVINQIGAGYQESPGFKFRLNQGENAINNAAAAGGMAGTGQHQQQAGELAENLAGEDYWNFVNHGVDMYGKGLSGQGDLAHLGASSGSDLGQSLANLLAGRAGLNYKQGANQNQANSDLFSSILGYLTKNSGDIKKAWG